jgi:transposase
MRSTSILRLLLGNDRVVVEGCTVVSGGLALAVRPTWERPRCSGCGRKEDRVHDVHVARSWRHLDFGGVRVSLVYNLRRIRCRKCGVTVEKVPWTDSTVARFTQDFDDQVAFLAQEMSKTAVENLMGIAWRTVGTIIERVVKRRRPGDALANLSAIGIDELSYRKQHHYITLVTNHDTGTVVWGKAGKDAATLKAFFVELGEEKCRSIKVVTIDMSGAFIKAVREMLPHAQIVFDRFHVQQLASNALDEVRRDEWQALRGTPEAEGVKNLRWPLLKSKWNLNQGDRERLSDLPEQNARLYRGYMLKEALANILGGTRADVVDRKLREWVAWAQRSRLEPFRRVAKTIATHLPDIVAYVSWKLTNGLSEGLNNKARLLTRRAYGFHSAEAVIAMVMLCCTGLQIEPVRKEVST